MVQRAHFFAEKREITCANLESVARSLQRLAAHRSLTRPASAAAARSDRALQAPIAVYEQGNNCDCRAPPSRHTPRVQGFS